MLGGERGIRLSAIADRVRQRRNRVQLGDASAYPSFEDLSLRRQYNTSNIKKDNLLRLPYAWRREGFAFQRLPIGYAEGAIACSSDMPRHIRVSKTSLSAANIIYNH